MRPLTTTSAAWLHGWVPERPTRPQLWTSDHRSRKHPVATMRRWQRIDPTLDVTTIDGVPTLNRAATLCSLGPHVDGATLERCLDEFLRRESERWLQETMLRLGSRKPGGVARLRSLIGAPHRTARVTDSWFETVLASLLATPQLPRIVTQHQVDTAGGRFRLDLACPSLKLGVEAHSRTFHWGPIAANADNVRELHLTSEGWQILYVTWSQLADPGDFVESFVRTASARADLLGLNSETRIGR